MPPATRRLARWTIGLAGVVLLAVQLIRPALPGGPVDATIAAPPEVLSVLRRACFDCHSNETRLPWFDQIVPAYWLVVDDVLRGRARLDFSELAAKPPAAQQAALFEAVNFMRFGAMPPSRYTLVHRDAVITPADVATLEAWLRTTVPVPAPAPVVATPAARPASVRPAPNGLAFEPGYRDWRVVSSSDRFDNGTMRQIVGNDVAIRAIEQGAYPPWPDGTMFAKVTFRRVAGDGGAVRAGPFVQVELMVKDAARWTSTDGWGYGRWRGEQLEPYGADASFTTECAGCHAPMRDADFVYTSPIARGTAG